MLDSRLLFSQLQRRVRRNWISGLMFQNFVAHGLVFATDTALNVRRMGDSVAQYRIAQRPGADAPKPALADWVARGSGHLDVAQCGQVTLLVSYCGSRAWLDVATDGSRLPTVFVARASSISADRFTHTVLHSFLPNALTSWGHLTLHAACVVVDGRALLLSGLSGSGKSTLAAGAMARGWQVLSDDVIRIASAKDGYVVYPGYPGARLRSGSFLLPAPKGAHRIGRFGLPKHRIRTDAVMGTEPYPVAGVFFLGRSLSPVPALESLSGGELLDEWLNAAFVQAIPRERFARYTFETVGALARNIPAYRLRYKRSARHFDQLLDGIVELARGLPGAA